MVSVNMKKDKNVTNVGTNYRRTKKGICKTHNIWILVIACPNSRAVHLELFNYKTTEEFVPAMKRFCNRRSTP